VRPEGAAGGAAGAAAGLTAPAAAATAAAGQVALSRYRSDFQELNPLGRGGFGVVVAAINRYAWLAACIASWQLKHSHPCACALQHMRKVCIAHSSTCCRIPTHFHTLRCC
jgi:hypothetical protein